MEANQYHQERINLSSASTSAAQVSNSMGQSEFLFRTPVSHTEEPESPNFSQQMGRRKFPHASIPFDYSSGDPTPVFSSPNYSKSLSYEEETGGERETSHPQSWSTPLEYTLPRVTSHVVLPTSTASYLSEEVTNDIYQFLTRHHPSFRSLHIPSVHQPLLLNPLQSLPNAQTYTIPPNPMVNFPTQNPST